METGEAPGIEENAGAIAVHDENKKEVKDASTVLTVTAVEDGFVMLTGAEGIGVEPFQKLTLGTIECTAVDDLSLFSAGDGSFITFSGNEARLLTASPLETGQELEVEVKNDFLSLDDYATGPFSLALSGGSIHQGLVCVSNSLSDTVIQNHSVNAVIVLSCPDDSGELFSFLEENGLVYEGGSEKDAILFIMENDGPYLIASSEEEGLLRLPVIIACLMGAREAQIVDDYANALDLDEGGRAALGAQIDRLLSSLNGGTLPSDASLLSMSTNHLNTVTGLSFSDIPSLRLHLR